jgi:hypothetical protein
LATKHLLANAPAYELMIEDFKRTGGWKSNERSRARSAGKDYWGLGINNDVSLILS